jgi:hypothetical protein
MNYKLILFTYVFLDRAINNLFSRVTIYQISFFLFKYVEMDILL